MISFVFKCLDGYRSSNFVIAIDVALNLFLKSDNYCCGINWKSDNYMGSNIEKKRTMYKPYLKNKEDVESDILIREQ